MRELIHRQAVLHAREWLVAAKRYAADLKKEAQRRASIASRDDSTLVADLNYWADLILGNVAWLDRAVPGGIDAVGADDATEPERVLARLGLTTREARLDTTIEQHYLRVLEASEWNARVAALVLGVSKRSVYRFTARRMPRR